MAPGDPFYVAAKSLVEGQLNVSPTSGCRICEQAPKGRGQHEDPPFRVQRVLYEVFLEMRLFCSRVFTGPLLQPCRQ